MEVLYGISSAREGEGWREHTFVDIVGGVDGRKGRQQVSAAAPVTAVGDGMLRLLRKVGFRV